LRIACELSTVGIQEWYKWKNDPRIRLDTDQPDSFILPREPNIWLEQIINKKNPKIDVYKQKSNAAEVWLIAHSSLMKPYDFFVLDDEFDLPLLQNAAEKVTHQFYRIYVVSSTAGIAQIFPANPAIGPSLKLGPGVLKQLEVRVIKKDLSGGGRIQVAIRKEFKPDRQVILPPLGHYSPKR